MQRGPQHRAEIRQLECRYGKLEACNNGTQKSTNAALTDRAGKSIESGSCRF